jgi:hypothetical protein
VPQDHTCHKQFLELLLLLVVGWYVAHAHNLVSATPAQSTQVAQDHTCHKQFLELFSTLYLASMLRMRTASFQLHQLSPHTCHKIIPVISSSLKTPSSPCSWPVCCACAQPRFSYTSQHVPQDHTCHKQFLELLLLLVVGGYVAVMVQLPLLQVPVYRY